MTVEEENQLLQLARELSQLDRSIVKGVAEGRNTGALQEEFCRTRDQIKKLLGGSMPIKIRDPQMLKVLKWVREGDYFYVDKEERKIINLIRNNPNKFHEVLRSLGVDFDRDAKSKADLDLHWKLIEELTSMISAEDYFSRKDDFSTIIVGHSLPEKINEYFGEIRECFIFGRMYAAVGLCRVLIELSFRDKYHKLSPAKDVKAPNVLNMADPEKIMRMIREVCKRPRFAILKGEAEELYHAASDILHGREPTIKLEEAEVLKFIRRVFKLVEQLSDLGQ
jgi:hypothetical protein